MLLEEMLNDECSVLNDLIYWVFAAIHHPPIRFIGGEKRFTLHALRSRLHAQCATRLSAVLESRVEKGSYATPKPLRR